MAKKAQKSVKPAYLLTADEPQMKRWRSAAAASDSSSFAEFARGALEAAAASPEIVPTGRFIGQGLIAISNSCYSGYHGTGCTVAGCECSCHK